MINTVTHKRKLNCKLKKHWYWAVICSALAVIFFSSLLFSAKPAARHIKNNNEIYNLSSQTGSTIRADEWSLLLVNAANPLPDDYSIILTQLSNGLEVDERCYPDLQAMMDACRADGLSPVICSAYRSQEKQQSLFQKKLEEYMDIGYDETKARQEAAQVVAIPGTSEHQTGLALDIVDFDNQFLDEDQAQTAVQQWLTAHSWKYGFIMRYPLDKSEITGIVYEPWHYRYVGKEAAQIIYQQNLCLEEFIALLNEQEI